MAAADPFTGSVRAQLRALLSNRLPAAAVERLIDRLGQIVVACRAGTLGPSALARDPIDGLIDVVLDAETRLDAVVAESQRFWQTYRDHLMPSADEDAAELAHDYLLALRLEPVAEAAGVPPEGAVRLFEDFVRTLAAPSRGSPRSTRVDHAAKIKQAYVVAQDIGAALLGAGVSRLTTYRGRLFVGTVRIVFKAAGLSVPQEIFRLLRVTMRRRHSE